MSEKRTRKRTSAEETVAAAAEKLIRDREAEMGKRWRCEVERRIIPPPYLPVRCRLWLPRRNTAAPGHEKCGFTAIREE